MTRPRALIVTLLVASACLAADKPLAIDTFNRDVRECAKCHASESRTYPATPMAHAAETVAECGILRSHPHLHLRLGRFDYSIDRKGDESIYTVSDGAGSISLPIKYALGLGEAGQTYVLQQNGAYYESFVSYYKAIDGLDITIGDQALKPSSLEDAAGRKIGPQEVALCFGCHTTNSIHNGTLAEDKLIPGVQCESCHGPTENHLAGLKSGNSQLFAMKKLTAMTAEQSAQFCGGCHRTWEFVAEHGPHGVGNVRFQPYRMTNSKCFDVDDVRISCTTCHNPHQKVDTVAADYDAKCQACHVPAGAGNTMAKAGAKLCPVATRDCTSCHMPKVELPGSHHLFTDHDIRIASKNGAFPE
jgi:hypothetical protein